MATTHELREEPTLGALLRSVAYTRLPTQFYQLLQLAIPFAMQLASHGMYRLAGLMATVSLFGMWALCVQRVDDLEPGDIRATWPRVGRRVIGFLGGALAVGLALEAFVRFMAVAFHCPGCAG